MTKKITRKIAFLRSRFFIFAIAIVLRSFDQKIAIVIDDRKIADQSCLGSHSTLSSDALSSVEKISVYSPTVSNEKLVFQKQIDVFFVTHCNVNPFRHDSVSK